MLEERQKRLAKGEFETTEEFLKRSEKEISAPILGELTADSIYAFESDDMQDLEAEYNADQQTLRIAAIFAAGWPPILHAGFHLIRFYRGEKYMEWEGYRVEVANFNAFQPFTFRYIRIKNRPYADMQSALYTKLALVANVAMDTPTAKRAKENLRFLVVAKLVPPYTVVKGDSGEQSDTRYHSLYVKMLELWFYDGKTGHVYAKLRPSQ